MDTQANPSTNGGLWDRLVTESFGGDAQALERLRKELGRSLGPEIFIGRTAFYRPPHHAEETACQVASVRRFVRADGTKRITFQMTNGHNVPVDACYFEVAANNTDGSAVSIPKHKLWEIHDAMLMAVKAVLPVLKESPDKTGLKDAHFQLVTQGGFIQHFLSGIRSGG